MKMEFNGNQFSASMNMNMNAEPQEKATFIQDEQVVGAVKKHFALIPAIIAFISALIQIPYGLMASLWAEFFVDLFGMNAARFALAVILINVVVAAITVALSVVSLVTTTKQKECRTNGISRILSIIALSLCGLALIVNIVCVILFVL